MARGGETTDPNRLGRYRVIRRIGAGGMGVVYLAVDAAGKQVAIKRIRADLADDPEFRTRFAREVAAARRVDGAFTAGVLDADLEAAVPFVVTEYVDGPNLVDAVRAHGPLTGGALVAFAVGLAEALRSIHALGLVHRDVKPSNVLLGVDGPRLIDFGIVQAADATSLTRTGVIAGSPGWLAPEQVRGTSTSPATDVFAWGTTVAFAAQGRSPFGEGRSEAVLYRVTHDDPDIAGLPLELVAPVSAALSKEQTNRPSATELVDQLTMVTGLLPQSFDDATVAAAVTSVWHDSTWLAPALAPEMAPTRSRRRIALAVVTGAVAVVGTIGFLFATRDDGANPPGELLAADAAASQTGSPASTTTTLARPTTTSSTTTTTLALVSDSQISRLVPGCLSTCEILDRVDGLSSPAGRATLALVKTDGGEFDSLLRVVVVSNEGQLLWASRDERSAATADGKLLADPLVIDAAGNVLGSYVQGAHSGWVLAMRVTPDGITDFGSIDESRFESASPPSAEDVNGDGVYEIFTNDNDYTPSYADGTRYTTEWHWSGSDYVEFKCTITPANGTGRTHAGPC